MRAAPGASAGRRSGEEQVLEADRDRVRELGHAAEREQHAGHERACGRSSRGGSSASGPTSPRMTSWWATRPGQAHGVDRDVARRISSAVRAAVPLGRVELPVVVELDDLGLAMCREASAAKRIISTAPMAKFGAKKTFAPCRRRGRALDVPARGPDDDVDAGLERRPRVGQRGVGPREVDEHVGVAEHVLRPRRPSAGIGAPVSSRSVGRLDGRAHRLPHPPGRTGDGDADQAALAPPPRASRAPAAEGVLVGADARGGEALRAPRARRPARRMSSRRDRVDCAIDLVDRQQRHAGEHARRRAGSCARRSTRARAPSRPLRFSRARASSASVARLARAGARARRPTTSSAAPRLSARVPR